MILIGSPAIGAGYGFNDPAASRILNGVTQQPRNPSGRRGGVAERAAKGASLIVICTDIHTPIGANKSALGIDLATMAPPGGA